MLVGVFCLKSYNLAVLPYHKQEEKNDIRKNADDDFWNTAFTQGASDHDEFEGNDLIVKELELLDSVRASSRHRLGLFVCK